MSLTTAQAPASQAARRAAGAGAAVTPHIPHNPLAVFGCLKDHRELIARLARREFEQRYRGSLLGIGWSVLLPLLMLGVYYLVFVVIFGSSWTIPPGGKGHPALLLFSGLVLFGLFADCLNRAPGLMLENIAYIKKVQFPLEIMAWVSLISAAMSAAVSGAVMAVGYVVFLGLPPLTALLLPVVLMPIMLLIVGLTWMLCALGVYLRDLRHVIGVAVSVMMFLAPIFYPAEMLTAKFPAALRWVAYLNPLTIPLEQVREVLFWGQQPDWLLLGAYAVAAWTTAWAGLAFFVRTQRGFADVV